MNEYHAIIEWLRVITDFSITKYLLRSPTNFLLTRVDQGLSVEATKAARTTRAEFKVGNEKWRVETIQGYRFSSTRLPRTSNWFHSLLHVASRIIELTPSLMSLHPRLLGEALAKTRTTHSAPKYLDGASQDCLRRMVAVFSTKILQYKLKTSSPCQIQG